MNNKVLVLLLFGLWSFLSWRMYVCRIKQVCPGQTVQIADQVPTATPSTDADLSSSKVNATEDQATSTTESKKMAQNEADQSNKGHEELEKAAETETAPVRKNTSVSEDHISIEETANEAVIHFPYNSVKKVENEEMDAYLSKLASRLKGSSEKVLITGHTDGVGDASSNEKIALERANSIKAILVKKGVSAKLITCRSFGERKPVASDDTPKGRYQNRRVVLTVQ